MGALALQSFDEFTEDGSERSEPASKLDQLTLRTPLTLQREGGITYVSGNSNCDSFSTVLHRPEISDEARSMSPQFKVVNSPSSTDRNSPITETTIIDITTAALAEEFKDASDKEIARFADSTPRTVKSWRKGEHCPQVAPFLNMARRIPSLKAAVKRLLEMEVECDPEAEKLLMQMMRVVERRIGRKAP